VTRLAVVGCWHQASVVSACLAELGNDVTGIGEDTAAIAGLQTAKAPVYEPGLDDMIARNVAAGRLRYTTDYAAGLRGAEIAFICIDTPVDEQDESDLSGIERAAEAVALAASGPLTLSISAQVPVGTTHRLGELVRRRRPELAIPVAYVPEFLRLGSAIETFMQADRFVVGADDRDVAERVAKLYEPLGRPIHLTDVRSAEMAKHASNAFLATSISFINQIADLCEQVGADATEVGTIMKLDRRIGEHAFVSPGLGYAGGTLGRELRALDHIGEAYGVETDLLAAVEAVNARRVPRLVDLVARRVGGLEGARIALLGLTYKAGTSTLRRSAALHIAELLRVRGARIVAFDPLARLHEAPEALPFEVCDEVQGVANGASALVLVTPWAGIAATDWASCARAMEKPIFIDSGNYLPSDELRSAGFDYIGVGRG